MRTTESKQVPTQGTSVDANISKVNQHLDMTPYSLSFLIYNIDNLRVLRKNLLFCSGLPLELTETDIRSEGYFGKYGKVSKVILLKNLRQISAYVTYSDAVEASLAILVPL